MSEPSELDKIIEKYVEGYQNTAGALQSLKTDLYDYVLYHLCSMPTTIAIEIAYRYPELANGALGYKDVVKMLQRIFEQMNGEVRDINVPNLNESESK